MKSAMENFAETADLYTTLFAELKKLGVKVPKTKKFKSSIPREEKTASPTETKMFGVDLSKQEWSYELGSPLPKFIAVATTYLLKYPKAVGLFRLSGSIKRQKNLRVKIENGESLEGSEPNDVASLLKQWLRELPESLIPRCMHDLFTRCQQLENKENRIAATLLACLILPPENLYTLKHLVCFLKKFAAGCYENKMGPHNLALIMAPNIFVSKIDYMDKNCKSIVQVHTSIIELLIENCEKIGEIPSSVSLHSAIQESKSTSDSDSATDVLGSGTLKLNRKRRNGPVHDLFCGIRKLVGQNTALSKIQEKTATALVPRSAFKRKAHPEQHILANKKRSILSDVDESPLPKTKEVCNMLQGDARMNDLRKSFGLLRRKETKRNNFIKSSQPNLPLLCHQDRYSSNGPDPIAEISTVPNESQEIKSTVQCCPTLKSESKIKSKSEYNVTLIGKQSYEFSEPSSSLQRCIQDNSRSASLCWLQADTLAEINKPSMTQDSAEIKTSNISKDTVVKIPQKSRRQSSLTRGKPNSVKIGLLSQYLNDHDYGSSIAKSNPLTNENAVSKSKKIVSGKTNSNMGIKKCEEKYSSMQSEESSKYSKNVSRPNIDNRMPAKPFNFDPIISLSRKNESVKQAKYKRFESALTENCPKNFPILSPIKALNKLNSKIPILRPSLTIERRKSLSEIEYNGSKISESRLSDGIGSTFPSKIPVMSKRISASDLNCKRYKPPKEISPRISHSISLISDTSFSNFSSPEENAFNKRESIAMILKNNLGHVKATAHQYDKLTPVVERKRLSSNSMSINNSLQNTPTYRKKGRVLNVTYSCNLSEEKMHSKSKVKRQKLSPLQISIIDFDTSFPNRPLKEVTNVRLRSYGERNFRNSQIQDESQDYKKLRKLKSNSFSGCKAYKVPKSISRSASSPGCPKPGNRLHRLNPVSVHSNSYLLKETIEQRNSLSIYSPPNQHVKTGSVQSLDKFKTDVMIDEWQYEL